MNLQRFHSHRRGSHPPASPCLPFFPRLPLSPGICSDRLDRKPRLFYYDSPIRRHIMFVSLFCAKILLVRQFQYQQSARTRFKQGGRFDSAESFYITRGLATRASVHTHFIHDRQLLLLRPGWLATFLRQTIDFPLIFSVQLACKLMLATRLGHVARFTALANKRRADSSVSAVCGVARLANRTSCVYF